MPQFTTRNVPPNKIADLAAAYEKYFGLKIGVDPKTQETIPGELTGDFNAAQAFFRRCCERAAQLGSLELNRIAAQQAAVPDNAIFNGS